MRHDVKKDNKKIKSYNRSIKLANYDGTGEWRDYKSHFDAFAAINDWDNEEKGLYLVALAGRDCLILILISEFTSASRKCSVESVSLTSAGALDTLYSPNAE
jgi:hypothetical protein